MNQTSIYCCSCDCDVSARLTSGKEIYPHRVDLHKLPFWKCDNCKNFVGCHHKTKERTKPLGCIPSKEIKQARQHIHKLIDPMWRNKEERTKLYKKISDAIGKEYHTAEIRSLDEAKEIYKIGLKIKNEIPT